MAAEITIERFAYTDMGTFGRMSIAGQTLYTVERPWLDNRPSISCIPEGAYNGVLRRFNRGGYDAVEICDVPERSYILFHRGNTMHDVAGCVAVTHKLGCVNGMWAGLRSRDAFNLFMHQFRLGLHGRSELTIQIAQYKP